jgi:regulator of PEP synthase PpsR (kinase-PPPase family)
VVPSVQVYIVSGGMGASGEQLARTALAQFEEIDVPVTIVPRVRTAADLIAIVGRAEATGGIILHTLVDPHLRAAIIDMARRHGVVEVDAMGPVLDRLAKLLDRTPLGTPGLYRKLRKDYFRRVEAIEFAVFHDDGRNCHELPLADVVLAGVSRSGKTPLSMYLAMHGFKTANVALVGGIEPPRELFAVDRHRVVGLTLEPDRLVVYRRRRQQDLGVTAPTDYSDPRVVLQDLEHSRQVFRTGRFATVDVTSKPIEESANEVVALVTRNAGGQNPEATPESSDRS